MLRFEVPGKPVGYQRAGHSRVGYRFDVKTRETKPYVQSYTPKETREYMARVAEYAIVAGAKRIESGRPVGVYITVLVSMPPSLSNAEKQRRAARKYAIGKPDSDNIEKSVHDALSGIAYGDDSQIAEGTFRRVYDDRDAVIVEVADLLAADGEQQKLGG